MTDVERQAHPKRPPLWLIFSITATGIMANTMVGPAIPDILEHFGRPDGDAGIFVAAGPASAILLAPVFGVLADRWGRRIVLVPSLVAFGIGGTLGMIAPGWWLLIAARFVQGVGAASLVGLAVSIIADNWSGAERIKYISWNSAILTVGVAAFPPVGGVLAGIGSWRWAFGLFPIGFVTAVMVWFTLDGPVEKRTTSLRSQLTVAATALRRPAVRGAMIVGFVVFIMIFGLFLTAFPLVLDDDFGLGAAQRGLVIGIPAVSSTIAALVLSRVRARFGARRLIGVAMLVLGGSYALVGTANTIIVIVVASLIYGFAEGSLIPTLQEIVSSSAEPDARAAVVSSFVSVIRAGQTVGPLLAAVLVGGLGAQTLFLIGAAALTGIGLAVLASKALDVA